MLSGKTRDHKHAGFGLKQLMGLTQGGSRYLLGVAGDTFRTDGPQRYYEKYNGHKTKRPASGLEKPCSR